MSFIEINKLNQCVGEKSVLQDVSLTIEQGEFVTLLGSPGCGKSSLAHLVAGLDSADSGDIIMNGTSVNALPPSERGVAMLIQPATLFPQMSVRDNLAFALRLQGMIPEDVHKVVSATASLLGIKLLLDHEPQSLSTEDQQRVAIARVVAQRPGLLVLDEPLAKLTLAMREHMRVLIKKLHEKLRITTLYMTQDPLEALSMSDRVVVLHDGKVQQIDHPRAIYEAPANRYVAALSAVPGMNFIRGVYNARDGNVFVDTDFGYIASVPALSVPNGSDVVVGIRPHDMGINDDFSCTMVGRIDRIEYTGASSVLHLCGPTDRLCIVVATTPSYALGSQIGLFVDVERLYWFDADTGSRVEKVQAPEQKSVDNEGHGQADD